MQLPLAAARVVAPRFLSRLIFAAEVTGRIRDPRARREVRAPRVTAGARCEWSVEMPTTRSAGPAAPGPRKPYEVIYDYA